MHQGKETKESNHTIDFLCVFACVIICMSVSKITVKLAKCLEPVDVFWMDETPRK